MWDGNSPAPTPPGNKCILHVFVGDFRADIESVDTIESLRSHSGDGVVVKADRTSITNLERNNRNILKGERERAGREPPGKEREVNVLKEMHRDLREKQKEGEGSFV